MLTINISEIQEKHTGPMLVVCSRCTGVRYGAQAGGVHCARPYQEGILVPLVTLGGENHLLNEFTDVWYPEAGIVEAYAERLEAIALLLKAWHLDTVLEPLDRYIKEMFDLRAWGEAWLPVRIKDSFHRFDLNGTALETLRRRRAILTYQNSD